MRQPARMRFVVDFEGRHNYSQLAEHVIVSPIEIPINPLTAHHPT
jgi:hypothetical protein